MGIINLMPTAGMNRGHHSKINVKMETDLKFK